jgi:hypothetical protein
MYSPPQMYPTPDVVVVHDTQVVVEEVIVH